LSATGVQCIETVPVARDLRSVDIGELVYQSDFSGYTNDITLEQNDSVIWEDRCSAYGQTDTGNISRNPLWTHWYTEYGTLHKGPVPDVSTNVVTKILRRVLSSSSCSGLLKTHTTGISYAIKCSCCRENSSTSAIHNAVTGLCCRVENSPLVANKKEGIIVAFGYPASDSNTKYSLAVVSTTSIVASPYEQSTEIVYLQDLTLPMGGVWWDNTLATGYKYVPHELEVRVNGNYFEVYVDSIFITSFTTSLHSSGNQVGPVVYKYGDETGVTSFSLYTAQPAVNISDTKIVAISGGSVYNVLSSDLTTISTGTFSSSDRIHVQGAYQKFYIGNIFASLYKIYDPVAQTVIAWTPTAGSLPTDDSSYGCPYITLYRGRIVLWGLISSPQNWYMSKVGDPLDWEYAPEVSSEVQAIAGNNSTAGLLGDALISCIPYSDDLMLMGGDHTLWIMRGDPASGGVIDLLSEKTGIRSPDSYCIDPGGTIYFLGTDAVYMFQGESISSITDASLRGVFENIDYTKYWPIMEWSYFERGCYLTLVPLDVSTDDYITYFYHPETQSWWQDIYPDNIGPYVLKAVDGNKPNDTVLLIGSPDGYIRYVNDAATTDDGTAITSEIDMQTIFAGASNDVKLNDIRAITDTGSATLTAKIYKGNTPQQANDSTTIALAKNLVAGRSTPIMQRIAAPALRIRLSSTGRWGLEQFMVTVDSGGKNKVHRG
jgi:hypothetical protein